MKFADRRDAGMRLAKALARYDSDDAVVYALPRGGVVLAREVATQLELPLALVIARKIGHPENEEYAICAVAEEGEPVCDTSESRTVDPAWLAEAVAKERSEAKRRRAAYDGPDIPATGKIAIIVDDGIATGLTMRAAIRALRRELPSEVIAAAPVAPHEVLDSLAREADDVVVLHVADPFMDAVGAYYDSFPPVSDDEVIAIMREQDVKTGTAKR